MEATIYDRRRCKFPHNRKEGCREHQSIDEGTLIDVEKGKLTGFRVVAQGELTSESDIGLTFRCIKILRKLRFPRLFGEINVCLPSRLIRWFASRNKVEGEERGMAGPYLRLRYVDDNLHMHVTIQKLRTIAPRYGELLALLVYLTCLLHVGPGFETCLVPLSSAKIYHSYARYSTVRSCSPTRACKLVTGELLLVVA